MEIDLGRTERLVSSFEVKVPQVCDFANLSEFFLQLEEIKVGMLDPLIGVRVLTILPAGHFAKSIVVLLVTDTFLFLLLQLKLKSIDIFSKGEKHV